ncbi:hypothetical protein J132_04951 [Termitomyces sp. J132]|nr:hypothetical protein J132_04951 [Termitomyces sp. J132]
MGYVDGHYSYGHTLSRIYKARDWFSIWMGLLSYLIAKAKSANATDTDVYWQVALCDNGFPIKTVDALQASTVCDFSPNTERAGIFLDITSKDTRQPAIEWFLKYNILVWYCWGSKEVAISSLTYLAPTASQMQRTVLALTNPVHETHTLSKQLHPSTQMTKRPEYEAFLSAQDKRNARRLLSETPAA